MSVSIRFKVRSIELVPYSSSRNQSKIVCRRVKLMPIGGEVFAGEQPSGCLDMLVVDQTVADQFELDGEYEILVNKTKDGLPVTVTC